MTFVLLLWRMLGVITVTTAGTVWLCIFSAGILKMCFPLTSKLVLMTHLTLLSLLHICVVMAADGDDS